jgi:hypothetical protein
MAEPSLLHLVRKYSSRNQNSDIDISIGAFGKSSTDSKASFGLFTSLSHTLSLSHTHTLSLCLSLSFSFYLSHSTAHCLTAPSDSKPAFGSSSGTGFGSFLPSFSLFELFEQDLVLLNQQQQVMQSPQWVRLPFSSPSISVFLSVSLYLSLSLPLPLPPPPHMSS